MSVYWKKIRAVIKPLLLFGLIQDSGSEVLFCIGLLLVGRLRGWRAPWAWKGLNEPLFFANFNCMACALGNEAYCCILVGQNPHYCLPSGLRFTSVICCPDLCPLRSSWLLAQQHPVVVWPTQNVGVPGRALSAGSCGNWCSLGRSGSCAAPDLLLALSAHHQQDLPGSAPLLCKASLHLFITYEHGK